MNIRPIRNEEDLSWALAEIAPYFDNQPTSGTPDTDRFDVLATLIEAYEARHHTIPEAEPLDVLRYALVELGHTQSDLSHVLGSRSRASEVLSGRRALTIDMIRKISTAWNIPILALVPKSTLETQAA